VSASVLPEVSGWWAPALAFVAGRVSFASPCVLPLVLGYLSFIAAGPALDTEARYEPGRPRGSTLITVLLFVLGFASVFTALGAATGRWFRSSGDRPVVSLPAESPSRSVW
jgi:cytochrome c biogenesis protein CcdA